MKEYLIRVLYDDTVSRDVAINNIEYKKLIDAYTQKELYFKYDNIVIILKDIKSISILHKF